MTKKHFIRAAEIVNAIRLGDWTDDPPSWAIRAQSYSGEYGHAVKVAEAFIALASEFNSRFDRDKFLVACGLMDTLVKKG